MKRILRCLARTFDTGLVITPSLSSSMALEGFCDADWASDSSGRRFTSGYYIFFGSNLVFWQSKKQRIVCHSNTKTGYRSLAHVTIEITWITSLLDELKIHLPKPPFIWYDNLSTILLSANLVQHARTKHIVLTLYFVREKVLQRKIVVKHLPSVDQVADVLTKIVSSSRFHYLSDYSELTDAHSEFEWNYLES